MIWLTTAVATLLAGIVLNRALAIINHMDPRAPDRSYWHFLGFGLSTALLGVAAFLVLIDTVAGRIDLRTWLFLIANAGLIVFDRRARRDCFDPGKCRNRVTP